MLLVHGCEGLPPYIGWSELGQMKSPRHVNLRRFFEDKGIEGICFCSMRVVAAREFRDPKFRNCLKQASETAAKAHGGKKRWSRVV